MKIIWRMKKHRIIVGVLLLLAGGIALNSCIKENSGQTIALIGTEYYIDDILSVIPDTLQEKFNTAFGEIPEGFIPEKIEGSYVVHPNMLVGTNLNIPTPRVDPDITMRFSKQNNGTMVMDLFEEASLQTTTPVYVMGDDKDFTVYFVEDKSLGQNIQARRGVVICGRLTDYGLANLRMAFVILEAGSGSALIPGTYYYYEDGNGLAERCDWPW